MNNTGRDLMYHFLEKIIDKVNNKMSYRDAILLTSVEEGNPFASWVLQADRKFQEATYKKTPLSQQKNVDECALASMGQLWHGENFEGSTEQMDSSEEETILDTLYFILKC